jgi:hypothetical protein
VSVRRKGEDERKEEGGEVSVNEGEGKERKEKRKRMGGGGCCTWHLQDSSIK